MSNLKFKERKLELILQLEKPTHSYLWDLKVHLAAITSPTNRRICPSGVGLVRERVRRYFYQIIVRPAECYIIRAECVLSIVLLGICVFLVWLFHVRILAPKLGVC